MVNVKSVLFALSAIATASAAAISKRDPFSGAQAGSGTWFNVGLGACGISNVDSDHVVAVGHALFDTYPGYAGPGTNPNVNPICGRLVTASFGGRSVQVKIVDRCTGCAEFDLDLVLADPGVGRIPITWAWN